MKWQTRTLATYVAATVPLQKAGDVNPLLESAQSIGMDERELKAVKEFEEAKAQKAMVDPPTGSFERFMSTFGSPSRWAGAN